MPQPHATSTWHKLPHTGGRGRPAIVYRAKDCTSRVRGRRARHGVSNVRYLCMNIRRKCQALSFVQSILYRTQSRWLSSWKCVARSSGKDCWWQYKMVYGKVFLMIRDNTIFIHCLRQTSNYGGVDMWSSVGIQVGGQQSGTVSVFSLAYFETVVKYWNRACTVIGLAASMHWKQVF